eukprot:TRINITY_DN63861_c0_g1_i1.p1 TRINITY_DN63861_c0_g1~~TRINITY_DN63861_c0_g1_i1.p1  ORF type:complete len:450 (-),score=112.05 TRINITY_DN63861_c0_g1_i1:193-1542(-)
MAPRSSMLLSAALALTRAQTGDAAYSFVTLGDWGGASLGGYHASNALAVAKQLGKSAGDVGAHFVLNTGDNFYYCGVRNITDEQFRQDFEDVYTDKSLMVPWYGVLGNHDYAYDVDSQLNYKSPKSDRWQMPARYFSKRIALSASQYATIVFLDTNPCVQQYRDTDPKYWDPCSGEFGDECFTGSECKFHDHVVSQNCDAQYAWLQKTLEAVPKDDWVIAVGHHPANEVNAADITGLLQQHNVKLYLNGHTHDLEHYRMDGHSNMDYVTSGAGCMVHTKDQDNEGEYSGPYTNGHSRDDVFRQKVSGFTVHTFSEDFATLTTKFLTGDGSEVHSFVTAKNGPSPPAPPAPPSHGNCKSFGCNTFDPKHTCQCNDNCEQHHDCCQDYQEVCGGPSPPPPPPGKGSCKKYGCHKYNPHHQCQCNDFCDQHHDCCADYNDVCGGHEEEQVVV